ncbi:hypothetical protein GCM10008933_29370 [Paenibacillus motobuensis]|uniref:Uncharacterized protein n=1 Tax=Paenibacillus motobuensis TaxID=295324 RepID=A0ABP3IBP2_9BACL
MPALRVSVHKIFTPSEPFFFHNLSFGEHIFRLLDIRYVRRMDKERADREQGENDLSV